MPNDGRFVRLVLLLLLLLVELAVLHFVWSRLDLHRHLFGLCRFLLPPEKKGQEQVSTNINVHHEAKEQPLWKENASTKETPDMKGINSLEEKN